MNYVVKAMKIYEKNVNQYIEKVVECCWLICTISELTEDNKMVNKFIL